MAGDHRRKPRPLIDELIGNLRGTGGLVAGATVLSLAAVTAQVTLASADDAAESRAAARAADVSHLPQEDGEGEKAGKETGEKAGQKSGGKAAGKSGESREADKAGNDGPAAGTRDAERAKPTAEAAIKIARSQVGITENRNGETKFQDWYMTTERAKETVARDGGSVQGYDDANWCSMFISWVGDRIGFRHQVGMDPWTIAHARWFKEDGRWGTKPRPGAIVFFAWDGGKDLYDIVHVGMVIKDNRDGTVQTVEGNTANAVRIRERPARTIVGYGYPDYAES
ncbi:CHAP domain-containing protein [Actinomadura viridis]|uniref:C40 family peptidase n=1 Tax=Actinomadura viridis TaxID=58110 RepID=UPI00368B1230